MKHHILKLEEGQSYHDLEYDTEDVYWILDNEGWWRLKLPNDDYPLLVDSDPRFGIALRDLASESAVVSEAEKTLKELREMLSKLLAGPVAVEVTPALVPPDPAPAPASAEPFNLDPPSDDIPF